MSKVDWSKAPEWATCVVNLSRYGVGVYNYHWSAKPEENARLMRCETGTEFEMSNADHWEIIEHRPVTPTVVEHKLIMAPKAGSCTYEQFIASGWDDDQLVESGYATRINDDRLNNELWKSARIVGQHDMSDPINCRCTFTPADQPSTAPDLLQQAAQLLAERGQQYDKSGNERSAAKIVAAFNTITGRDLTPGEGWLFLTLLKAVRFYSNTETPHRDSLEDMIAYAALHAEEYLNDN